eukprot:4400-Heterococcus_DN1.PRE.3
MVLDCAVTEIVVAMVYASYVERATVVVSCASVAVQWTTVSHDTSLQKSSKARSGLTAHSKQRAVDYSINNVCQLAAAGTNTNC